MSEPRRMTPFEARFASLCLDPYRAMVGLTYSNLPPEVAQALLARPDIEEARIGIEAVKGLFAEHQEHWQAENAKVALENQLKTLAAGAGFNGTGTVEFSFNLGQEAVAEFEGTLRENFGDDEVIMLARFEGDRLIVTAERG